MASNNRETDRYQNLVITGFMGTGKSTVGVIVAAILGFRFVDTDAMIEARAGLTIPEIFEQYGETRFREMEREVAQDLNHEHGLVISTGGGMLIKPEMRELMMRHHLVVCLTASPDEIARRLAETEHRPLAKDWRRLYEERKSAYAQIPFQFDTTGKSPEQVAQEVIAIWQSVSK